MLCLLSKYNLVCILVLGPCWQSTGTLKTVNCVIHCRSRTCELHSERYTDIQIYIAFVYLYIRCTVVAICIYIPCVYWQIYLPKEQPFPCTM